jgi:predicted nucleic acid-binding protein
MRVYLDTNVLSRVTDLRLTAEDARALRLIGDAPNVSLVASSETRRELAKTPDAIRNQVLMFLCSLFSKVPDRIGEVSGCLGSAPLGRTPLGGGWVDPSLRGLRAIFDPDDAQHIFVAAKSGCEFFMTFDQKTILSRVRADPRRVEALRKGMRLVSPSELLSILEGPGLRGQ